MIAEDGRRSRPNPRTGIRGTSGGDPRSVKACHRIGLDDASRSLFQAPIARSAAAHAFPEQD